MNTAIAFTKTRKSTRINLLKGWLNGGWFNIYTAPKPATPDTGVSGQMLLATVTLPEDAGTVDEGVFIGAEIDSALVLVTGAPVWARFFSAGDVPVFDCDVGDEYSAAVVRIKSTLLVAGADLEITSFTISEG
jgi:hypothetical protein